MDLKGGQALKPGIAKIFIILLFIVGFGFLTYPTISNEWNTYVQSRLINSYEASVSNMSEADYSLEWQNANDFNSEITENDIGKDVFNTGSSGNEATPTEQFFNSPYYSVLNLNGNGVMGYLSVPKINLKLPIMHGTFDENLQTSLGHLNGTALPVGGPGTHSVIVGHRGLPTAVLFTDLDQMQIGDKFYVHILDKILAYEVDKISPMIPEEDIDSLSEAVALEEGKDYVTLFTCTPYGVNTHRLLVRGTRIEYLGEDEVPKGTDAVVETVKNYYLVFTTAGIVLVIIIILIIRYISKKKQITTD